MNPWCSALQKSFKVPQTTAECKVYAMASWRVPFLPVCWIFWDGCLSAFPGEVLLVPLYSSIQIASEEDIEQEWLYELVAKMLPWKRELGFWLNLQVIFIGTKITSIASENVLQSCLSVEDFFFFFLEGRIWVLKPLQTEEDLSLCFLYSGPILWNLHFLLEGCYCHHLPFLTVYISFWFFPGTSA